MCALFGFLDCGKRIPLKALQKLIQALANASEVRGDHASGISYMKDNQLTIYKRPKPAHKMKFKFPNHTNLSSGSIELSSKLWEDIITWIGKLSKGGDKKAKFYFDSLFDTPLSKFFEKIK